jgi:hypothetical protein
MFFFVEEEAQRGLRIFEGEILDGVAVDYACLTYAGVA